MDNPGIIHQGRFDGRHIQAYVETGRIVLDLNDGHAALDMDEQGAELLVALLDSALRDKARQ